MEITPSQITRLAEDNVQQFIFDHEHCDEQKLLLQKKEILGLPAVLIAQQIAGRRKARLKLPSWYNAKGIVYPPAINLEQSSSEATSHYKSTILQEFGKTDSLADLTGGFGVDSEMLSTAASELHYVEPEPSLLSIARHNHEVHGAKNIVYHQQTAQAFLKSSTKKFTWLYLDPSRRNAGQKVFTLASCLPNVLQEKELLLSSAEYALLKTSPLLDIQQATRELGQVKKIYAVAVKNECRELLFVLHPSAHKSPVIEAVDLDLTGNVVNRLAFTHEQEQSANVEYGDPQAFIYEPNAAMMKAGAFRYIARKFGLKKLAPSSHLYTSVNRQPDFPGRIFSVLERVKPDKKLKERFENSQANIIVRNFPLSVEELKKKTGLQEGGRQYLLCTSTKTEKWVLIAERVQ
ncbi:MAG: hypothetical protein K2U26_14670 [Cyclobacteriaceae bacterium]|nr:hypothetical protein [Cyclobacteriaceae bacterium]